jgi:serine/threonine protein kinase
MADALVPSSEAEQGMADALVPSSEAERRIGRVLVRYAESVGVPSTKRFAIRRRLGEGGMGVVYEAYDEERKATVALKTLNRFDAAALARFKREFRALQGLAHPNLVALDELLFENEEWFFTMELLDGVDFVTHVRGAGPAVAYQSTVRESVGKLAARAAASARDDGATSSFDEARLRDSLRQLLEGLCVLHAADKVHRDVKPSNVLVTREGRVVLLDFGLVTEASAEDRSTGSAVVGTPAYMAPEQAASRDVGPAADLYAVGVMLYEALTGRLPIDGPQLQILIDKQTKEPAEPASLVAEVPRDLNALCMKLLRFDPASRPSAAEVMKLLALPAPRASSADLTRRSTESPTFVGRTAELAELEAAYAACGGEQLSTALVCGESGIGKSYLVRRFTTALVAEHPEVVLLEGRCYERETVPYKALDGVVDALASRLARMPANDVAAILPTRSAVLAQVFPALLRVPQLAKEHAATALVVDPQEYRQRAFAALRDLFTRVAVRRPTVLVIDDLQWADDDGLRALAEILRPPDAPPLLLVGTVRVAPESESAALARLRAMMPGETRTIMVTSLSPSDARELAAALIRRTDRADADPVKLATEAGGHPLFLEELARHVALGEDAFGDVKLDGAIWSRIAQLDGKTREMAELVAVAGKPIPQQVLAAAAHVEAAEFTRRAATLRAANVARTGGARWADAIEPYHDRVREAVLGRLEAGRRRELHEALAVAFEASAQDDAETLATHWREAGNASRAARYAGLAGDQAAKAFAFDRAAQWYEDALGLLGEGDAGRRELHVKLGDALGNAGRGALAAPHLERAAAGAAPAEALELRRRAADQLLRSGEVDRGMDAIRDVLGTVGIALRTAKPWLVLALVWYRFLLALRGLRFRERESRLIPPGELTRVDACMVVATSCTIVDPLLAAVFASRALLLALRAGEPERAACSAAMVGAGDAVGGTKAGWRRAQRLFDVARELGDRCGSSVAQIYAAGCLGMSLYGGRGSFGEALSTLERCHELVKTRAPRLVFEVSQGRVVQLGAFWFLGRYKSMWETQQLAHRDALARGDLFSCVTSCVGLPASAWLTRDRADLAEGHAREALAKWSKGGLQMVHVLARAGLTLARLYAGDGESAHRTASELATKVRHSLSWRVAIDRVGAIYLRAMSAVAAAAQGTPPRDMLLAAAQADAHAIEGEDWPWTRPFAATLRAGIALGRGSRDSALSHLDAAARDFTAHDMLGYAAAARYHAANLRSDAAERERALDYFRGEEVVRPERMIRTLIAGFPE